MTKRVLLGTGNFMFHFLTLVVFDSLLFVCFVCYLLMKSSKINYGYWGCLYVQTSAILDKNLQLFSSNKWHHEPFHKINFILQS